VLAGAQVLEPTELKLNCQLTELCLLVLILAASASPSVTRDNVWGKAIERISC